MRTECGPDKVRASGGTGRHLSDALMHAKSKQSLRKSSSPSPSNRLKLQDNPFASMVPVVFRPPPGLAWPEASGASAGSLAHPQLCRRPCIHLLKAGSCGAGLACYYCHEGHDNERIAMPDKRQRQLLRTMREEDIRTLLRPYILCRLEQLELTEPAAQLLNLLDQDQRPKKQEALLTSATL